MLPVKQLTNMIRFLRPETAVYTKHSGLVHMHTGILKKTFFSSLQLIKIPVHNCMCKPSGNIKHTPDQEMAM